MGRINQKNGWCLVMVEVDVIFLALVSFFVGWLVGYVTGRYDDEL